jgi:hypothetical protein
MDVDTKKTGLKKVIIVMLAAFVGWIGCTSNEVTGNVDSGNGRKAKSDLKNVTLKIVSKLPDSRSEEDLGATKKTVNFNGGWILFASAQDNVTKVMEITTTNTNILSDFQVDISLLTQIGGVEIRDVPEFSQYVYVIGNLPVRGRFIVPAVGMNLTMLMQDLIVFSIRDDINNLVLFDKKVIMHENSKYVARFEFTPIIAHIESAKGSNGKTSDRFHRRFRCLPRYI